MYQPEEEKPLWLLERQATFQSKQPITQRRLQIVPRIRHSLTHRRKRTGLRMALLSLLAVTLFLGTSAGLLLWDIKHSIDKSTITLDGFEDKEEKPPVDDYSGRAVNIMVLGIDIRKGAGNEQFGEFDGALLNDTNFLMHISADRTRMQMVSIPRDTLIEIPACQLANGETSYPHYGQFNWAFGVGLSGNDPEAEEINFAPGIACVKKTMESLTGVEIDEFVIVDFGGFQSIVNALGGIEMCFNEDLYDPNAGLDLSAGCHKLNGFNALAYARTRSLPNDPSGDIGRMGRQQEVIGRILSTAKQQNLLTDFPKLYAFTKEGINSVKVSPNLSSLTTSTGLAYSLSSLPNSGIQFATMPWGQSPVDPNRVIPSELAPLVWEAIIADKAFPDGIEVRDLDGNVTIKGQQNQEDTNENSIGNTGENTPTGNN